LAVAAYPPLWLSGLWENLISSPDLPAGGGWRLGAFIVWLVSLGAMGAIAFLYVNALALQIDSSVDVASSGFSLMRVILGALFGLVIGLPLGRDSFLRFCDVLAGRTTETDDSDGLLLLLPFVLGFSTPLVLSVLNRTVESLQSLFGITPATSKTEANANPGTGGKDR
jgi:hypothetical protein